jgi:hypothetical protein
MPFSLGWAAFLFPQNRGHGILEYRDPGFIATFCFPLIREEPFFWRDRFRR